MIMLVLNHHAMLKKHKGYALPNHTCLKLTIIIIPRVQTSPNIPPMYMYIVSHSTVVLCI